MTGCADGAAPEAAAPTRQVTTTTTPEPVPWSAVEEYLERPHGSYTKTTVLADGDVQEVMLEEVVTYQLDDGFRDRRISAPSKAEESGEGLRLRFVHERGRILMWNPGAAAECGTPWVNMPSELLEATTGVSAEELGDTVEPVGVLQNRAGDPRATEVTSDETTFEVLVSGASGLTMTSAIAGSADARAKLEELAATERPAEVTVVRDGSIILTVDITEQVRMLAAALEGAATTAVEGKMTVSWAFDRPPRPLEPHGAEHVAEATCLS